MFQCIMLFFIYSLQIILMFFTGPSSIQIWRTWILLTYWGNLIISIRITWIIERDNEKEKYISYYRVLFDIINRLSICMKITL